MVRRWIIDDNSVVQKQPPEALYKKGVLKTFAIIGKHLESLFDIVVDMKAYNFIKMIFQHRCFPVNIAKLLTTAFT